MVPFVVGNPLDGLADETLDVTEITGLGFIAERDGHARLTCTPRAPNTVYVALGFVR